MKTMNKAIGTLFTFTFIFLAALVFSHMPVHASTGYSYDPNTKTQNISSDAGYAEFISEQTNEAMALARTYKVTIESMVIAPGVTTIVEDALPSCTTLTSVSIPNSVTATGTTAFQACRSLTSYIKLFKSQGQKKMSK